MNKDDIRKNLNNTYLSDSLLSRQNKQLCSMAYIQAMTDAGVITDGDFKELSNWIGSVTKPIEYPKQDNFDAMGWSSPPSSVLKRYIKG